MPPAPGSLASRKLKPIEGDVCWFCKQPGDDDAWAGLGQLKCTSQPMFEDRYILYHEACAVYSNGAGDIPLEGMDDESVARFWAHGEKASGIGLKCQLCGLRGATTGCLYGPCQHFYHYPCARVRALQGQMCFSLSCRSLACREHIKLLPAPHEADFLGMWMEGAGSWNGLLMEAAALEWLPNYGAYHAEFTHRWQRLLSMTPAGDLKAQAARAAKKRRGGGRRGRGADASDDDPEFKLKGGSAHKVRKMIAQQQAATAAATQQQQAAAERPPPPRAQQPQPGALPGGGGGGGALALLPGGGDAGALLADSGGGGSLGLYQQYRQQRGHLHAPARPPHAGVPPEVAAAAVELSRLGAAVLPAQQALAQLAPHAGGGADGLDALTVQQVQKQLQLLQQAVAVVDQQGAAGASSDGAAACDANNHHRRDVGAAPGVPLHLPNLPKPRVNPELLLEAAGFVLPRPARPGSGGGGVPAAAANGSAGARAAAGSPQQVLCEEQPHVAPRQQLKLEPPEPPEQLPSDPAADHLDSLLAAATAQAAAAALAAQASVPRLPLLQTLLDGVLVGPAGVDLPSPGERRKCVDLNLLAAGQKQLSLETLETLSPQPLPPPPAPPAAAQPQQPGEQAARSPQPERQQGAAAAAPAAPQRSPPAAKELELQSPAVLAQPHASAQQPSAPSSPGAMQLLGDAGALASEAAWRQHLDALGAPAGSQGEDAGRDGPDATDLMLC